MMIFNTMSVDGSNFQADMDALRLYYDALCEHSKDNSSFDSTTYTYEYFQSEFFHLWASQIITIIGSTSYEITIHTKILGQAMQKRQYW